MDSELVPFQTLVKIVERLRSPGGCPWDREQTHASLKRNMLEECYEALEAIDSDDPAKLSEELGDLLVQVVFHSQMAKEAQHFSIEDVVTGGEPEAYPSPSPRVRRRQIDGGLGAW